MRIRLGRWIAINGFLFLLLASCPLQNSEAETIELRRADDRNWMFVQRTLESGEDFGLVFISLDLIKLVRICAEAYFETGEAHVTVRGGGCFVTNSSNSMTGSPGEDEESTSK